MRKPTHRDTIHRWEGNPLINVEDLPFRCSDIRNAAAVKIDGTYVLLVTIETLEGYTHIYRAESKDYYNFKIDSVPLMTPSDDESFQLHEERGIMDPRITLLEGNCYFTYVAEGRYGYRIALAQVDRSFRSVTRLGFISEPDTKGGTIFPEKIQGRYARLERPREGGRIWISYSDDLAYWGNADVLLSPRGHFWDSGRIGDAVPPFRVEDGTWLLLYYGIKTTAAGDVFRMGAVFLDAEDPSRVVARTNIPLLSPRENYERVGDINNLVFSTGAILENNTLYVYYGAADSCLCLGTTTIDAIISECKKSSREF